MRFFPLGKAAPVLATTGLLSVTGCTVYAPMQPVMPLVRQRGERELSADVQPLGRLEARGAYSPLAHVVVTGGLAGALRLSDRTFLATRQAELGAGLYQPLGQRYLLSAVGGWGWAYAHRGYVDLGIFGPGTFSEYTAYYTTRFGQLGVGWQNPLVATSLTYRLVGVRFSELTDSDWGPLPLPAMTRHDLAASTRWTLDQRDPSRWQLLSTAGMSVSTTPRRDDSGLNGGNGQAEYQANRNLLPAFFFSLGLRYTPTPKRQRPAPVKL